MKILLDVLLVAAVLMDQIEDQDEAVVVDASSQTGFVRKVVKIGSGRSMVGPKPGAEIDADADIREAHSPLLTRSLPVPDVSVWPRPAKFTAGDLVLLADDFQIEGPARFSPYCKSYQDSIFGMHAARPASGEDETSISALKVTVEDDTLDLNYDVDESYELTVDSGSASITAPTMWGALRGLETFSQLVKFHMEEHRYYVPQVQVTDGPQFSHRGILIDTGRHFLPVKVIKLLLDSMQYAKLNVLHWHMTDIQAFPIESEVFPDLWKGAMSDDERYTQDDMRSLVDYAMQRGIRIIPELDMPGHVTSWAKGLPDIFPADGCANKDAFDPTRDSTYEALFCLFDELFLGCEPEECKRCDKKAGDKGKAPIFPDAYVHLGTDEVPFECWKSSPSIQAFMEENSMDTTALFHHFLTKISDYVTSKGKNVIMWDEAVEGAADKDKVVIQHWRSWDSAATPTQKSLTDKGYRVIESGSAAWYLDWRNTDWHAMYRHDTVGEGDRSLIYGGEGAMWGEHVDSSNIQSVIWPRMAAIAEQLWSGVDRSEPIDHVEARLWRYRCLLLQRGVPALPVGEQPGQSASADSPVDSPFGPGSCDSMGRMPI